MNREQDERRLPAAGESSLNTPYNNSEFKTKLNHFSSPALKIDKSLMTKDLAVEY